MARHQQDVQLAEQLAVGKRRALLVARLDQHPQDVVGGRAATLGDLGEQQRIQFGAHPHQACAMYSSMVVTSSKSDCSSA